MKKILISFLILITFFSSFGPSLYKSKILASETSSYQPVEANENSVIFENGDTIILSPQKRAPRGIIGSILIFVAGVLVGYIIDGVVVNLTGASSAEWVNRAINYFRNYPNTRRIYLSRPGAAM